MKIPYTCVCCGFTSQFKNDMRRHLYKKVVCQKAVNDIELTDEIKQKILKDRVYHIPKPNAVINNINTVINYGNTINNLVANLDTIEKLKMYMTHQDVELIDYGQTIESRFAKQVQKLMITNDAFGCMDSLILDKDNLLEVINQVSSLANEHCKNMNVIYDKKFDKLKLYDMGEWDEFILMKGICTLMKKIQEHYFNLYECYLIRKIEVSTIAHQDKAVIKEQLIEYYKFIGCFGIEPFVQDKNDSEIVYNQEDKRCNSFQDLTDENTELSARYGNLYTRVCGETKASELNKIKMNIIEIIKKNCMKNVDELNKRVVILFNMDEEFKNTILPS